jgi:uncharacterized integral membrane protein
LSSGKDSDQVAKKGFALTPRRIFGLVIALLALVFIAQNSRSGRVEFLIWEINAPGWLWMISLLAAGFIIGSMFPWFKRKERAR